MKWTYITLLALIYTGTVGASPRYSLATGYSLSEGYALEAAVEATAFRLRASLHWLSDEGRARAGSTEFDWQITLLNLGLFIDYPLPTQQLPALRLSAGLVYNDDHLQGDAVSTNGYYLIDDYPLPVSLLGDMNIRARYNRLQPYLGLGYDFHNKDPWQISLDAGVLFQGKPSVFYTLSGPVTDVPAYREAISAEEQKAAADLSRYSDRLVIRALIRYRF